MDEDPEESDDRLKNPHDRFVRRLLGDTDHVRELVRWQLPAEVVAELDLETLVPAKETFVDKTLRGGLSDLVFQVELAGGGDAFVMLLFEHKSVVDEQAVFQVLRYMVAINEQRQRNGQPLCCVIPLILYHGVRSWDAPRRLPELIHAPAAFRGYIPDFDMPLLDLSGCSDAELRRESVFLAYMTLLKYIRRDELPERLPEILSLFHRLLPPATALESIETILRYLVVGTDRVSRQELVTVFTRVMQSKGASAMPTIAEEWKEEGRQEGRQEGAMIGQVLAYQQFLGRPTSGEEALLAMGADELRALFEQLQAEFQKLRR
ncbi:putative transposase [Rosistilla carotiformis]|uniref:Putative transposase n=1 Tax=Rosistilla carotiformis TaxID=2528017 RepID=A0A518JM43_9BACT|nr:Rpn family recombination-promoting nuclease/putative transposase [Rosistilla carotiformis]QDV66621.1 putative transposase [Rosistilla carotiformis]